jgi:hypothetical protein
MIAGLAAVLIGCAPQPGGPDSGREPQATIPEGPDMRPTPVAGGETPCRTEIGEAAARRLVERCRDISPSTHPPCNAVNPCALIREHIVWACDKWGPGETRPETCVR